MDVLRVVFYAVQQYLHLLSQLLYIYHFQFPDSNELLLKDK